MVHRCLALLLIMDDHILSLETRIEGIFPRCSCLFDGVDELARRAEALPDNLDDMLRKLPHMIHQFPLLDWAVSLLISILTTLGSKNTRASEKEITIDVNCSEKLSSSSSNTKHATEHTKLVQFEKPYSYADAARNRGEIPKSVQFEESSERSKMKAVPNEVVHLSVKRLHSWKSRIKALEEPLSAGDSPMYSSYQSANTSPVSDCSQDENHPFNQLGCTYKEILEREMMEEDEGERAELQVEQKDHDQVVASPLLGVVAEE